MNKIILILLQVLLKDLIISIKGKNSSVKIINIYADNVCYRNISGWGTNLWMMVNIKSWKLSDLAGAYKLNVSKTDEQQNLLLKTLLKIKK
jgi:hypothetical protein